MNSTFIVEELEDRFELATASEAEAEAASCTSTCEIEF
jgi:hypothetical protein